MIRFIAIRTTLLVCILAHAAQSTKSRQFGGDYSDKCREYCRSKHTPGVTGEYQADCNVPDYITGNLCLGDCGGICPSHKCPNGQYVICPSVERPVKPPRPDPDNDMNNNRTKSGTSLALIIGIVVAVVLVLIVCCAGGCFWYYYSSKRRLRGNVQQQPQNNYSQQHNQYPPHMQQYQAPPPPAAPAPVTISAHYTTPTGNVQKI